MSQSQAQPLPPLKLVRPSGHQRIILSNLSYPSRPNAHVSWSRSSVPRRFAKNLDVRSHPTLGFSYVSASATTNDIIATNTHVATNEHDTEFFPVTHAFREMQDSIWHGLLIFTCKLKWLFQKLINTRAAPPDPSL